MTITTHQTITSYLKSRSGFGKEVINLFKSVYQGTTTESLDKENQWTILTLCHCLSNIAKSATISSSTREEVQRLHDTLSGYLVTFEVAG